jgi:hypothetical protein
MSSVYVLTLGRTVRHIELNKNAKKIVILTPNGHIYDNPLALWVANAIVQLIVQHINAVTDQISIIHQNLNVGFS